MISILKRLVQKAYECHICRDFSSKDSEEFLAHLNACSHAAIEELVAARSEPAPKQQRKEIDGIRTDF